MVLIIVDLDEQLSAFDYNAIIKQSVFVESVIRNLLQKYPKIDHFPIVAHSMGGIVVKDALIKLNDQKSWTLISIATPHKMPPFSISRQLLSLFSRLNSEWHQKMSASTLISISGGVLDTLISSDLTKVLDSLDMYTTGMVDVWSGADHRMLLWCNQLIIKLADFLLFEYPQIHGNQSDLVMEYFGTMFNHDLRLIPSNFESFKGSVINDQRRIFAERDLKYYTWMVDPSRHIFQIFSKQDYKIQVFGCRLKTCHEIVGFESSKIPVESDKIGRTDTRRVGRFTELTLNQIPELINVTIGISSLNIGTDIIISKAKNCDETVSFGFLGIY